MASLFIVAHAPLASALRSAALHCFPEAAGSVGCYDVPPGSESAAYGEAARALLQQTASDAQATECLVLTDVVGATPGRIAESLAASPVEGLATLAVAGANLPMLWRALNYRELPLAELARRARDGGLAAIQPLGPLQPPPHRSPSSLSSHHAQEHAEGQ